MKQAKSKPVIGWREWVALPDLAIEHVKVKVDTGARSSAIHASNLELFKKRGETWARFDVHPIQRDTTTTVSAQARVLDQRAVRDSGGKSERRVVIETTLRFMDESWPIELTLTSRDNMGFRMLLGREAVRGRFTVDPGRSFVGGRVKSATRKKSQRKRANHA